MWPHDRAPPRRTNWLFCDIPPTPTHPVLFIPFFSHAPQIGYRCQPTYWAPFHHVSIPQIGYHSIRATWFKYMVFYLFFGFASFQLSMIFLRGRGRLRQVRWISRLCSQCSFFSNFSVVGQANQQATLFSGSNLDILVMICNFFCFFGLLICGLCPFSEKFSSFFFLSKSDGRKRKMRRQF